MQPGAKRAVIAVLVIAIIGAAAVLLLNQEDSSSNNTSVNESSSMTEQTEMAEEQPAQQKNIVETAVATPSLSTLVSAVKAADLVSTLSGNGPFTVFAPTNDAFDKLPAGTLESLLKPESKATLTSILTYHVVSGKVLSGDLSDGQVVTTVQGQTLTVNISGSTVTLTDAKGGKSTVTATDIETSNGVVHTIDTVVMPN